MTKNELLELLQDVDGDEEIALLVDDVDLMPICFIDSNYYTCVPENGDKFKVFALAPCYCDPLDDIAQLN